MSEFHGRVMHLLGLQGSSHPDNYKWGNALERLELLVPGAQPFQEVECSPFVSVHVPIGAHFTHRRPR